MKHTTLALAICAAQLSAGSDNWRRILPVGTFTAMDGRPAGCKGSDGKPVACTSWMLTPEKGQQIVAALKQKQDRLVIDYEHQTLKAASNGLPAPAAGWMTDFEMRDDGLYALCSWTPKAQSMIDAEEYKYISPVFPFNAKTGMVDILLHAALTNVPALDGLTDVMATAALSLFSSTSQETSAMDQELLNQLIWMYNLPVGSTVEDVKAHMLKIISQLTDDKGMAAATVDLLALLKGNASQIAALTQQAAAATPDPTKFVPIEVMTALKQQIAALTQQSATNETDTLITAALSDGRLIPAQENWARDVGKANPVFLKTYLEGATPIAALTQQQTTLIKPDQRLPASGMTAEALAVCSLMGVDPADYQKS